MAKIHEVMCMKQKERQNARPNVNVEGWWFETLEDSHHMSK